MYRYPSWKSSSALVLLLLALEPDGCVGTARADICGKDTACMQLAQAGANDYKQARYAEALENFQQAYARRPAPELLINIGTALYQLARLEEAIATFQEYLQKSHSLEHASKIKRYIKKAEERLAAARNDEASAQKFQPEPGAVLNPSESDVASPKPPKGPFSSPDHDALRAPPVSSRELRVGVALGSIGLLSLLAGAACYGGILAVKTRFSSTADEYEKLELRTQSRLLDGFSIAAYTIGGVLLIAGTAVLGYGIRQVRKERTPTRTAVLHLQVSPSFAGALLRGEY